MLSSNQQSSDAKTLWIGEVEQWMDERFLFELFKDVGNVIGVKIKRDAASGKASTCYGFIDFRTHESAAQALRDYNGKLIPGTAKYVPVVYL
jgi:RNA recognition motif-containing protein